MSESGAITLLSVDKYYGTNHVLHSLDLEVKAGEFLSLLGPSGCGKTTILRLIAGFERLDHGSIVMDGKRIDTFEPYKRNVNTVFQNYALFPNMNVYDNIAYGLRAHYVSSAKIREKVAAALDMVQLTELKDRQISQMSGGQCQRVAIARALVNEPSAILLDEPLSALDLKLRKEMRYELRNLQKKLGITFIFVTHDQEEALVMSDRIAVMNEGRLEQIGTPRDIYEHPVSQFVSGFIGETNTFEAVISGQKDGDVLTLAGEAGNSAARGSGFYENEMVHVSVRPDKVLWDQNDQNEFSLHGTVAGSVFNGSSRNVIVHLTNGEEVKITRLAGEALPSPGDKISLYWNLDDAVVMHSYSNQVVNYFNDYSWINSVQKSSD